MPKLKQSNFSVTRNFLQNYRHVQHTDTHVNRNIIDNINLKTQNRAKHHTHTRGKKTKPHLIQDNQISPGLEVRN